MERKNKTENYKQNYKVAGYDFLENIWEESWTYIKTVVDVIHEPVAILDKNFRVMKVNESFLKTFHVGLAETEGEIIYDLGNGQWDIPMLRKLLEDILPKNTFFKGLEVSHDFPVIGKRIMILNARQIFSTEKNKNVRCPPIILLAMEDITEIMTVAKKLAEHTNQFEKIMLEKNKELEKKIEILKRELNVQ